MANKFLTPWSVHEVEGLLIIHNCDGDPLFRFTIKQKSFADLIVACVNALEGIDDPEEFLRLVRTIVFGNAGADILQKIEDMLDGAESVKCLKAPSRSVMISDCEKCEWWNPGFGCTFGVDNEQPAPERWECYVRGKCIPGSIDVCKELLPPNCGHSKAVKG